MFHGGSRPRARRGRPLGRCSPLRVPGPRAPNPWHDVALCCVRIVWTYWRTFLFAPRGASRPRPSEPRTGNDKASVHSRASPRAAGARAARPVQLVRDLRARGARPPEGHHAVKRRPLRHVLHEPTATRRAPAVGQGSRHGATPARVLERPPHTLPRSRLHSLDAGPKSGEPPHRITSPGERLALVELHGRQRSSQAASASAITSLRSRPCSAA